MLDLAAATVVAKSYLSFARVLAQSFHRHHPEIPFFVLLADELDGYFDPAGEPFTMVGLPDLDVPRLERFRFHYAQQPLSYAAAPYLLSHLLNHGYSRVVFLKQETLVLGPLTSLFDCLSRAPVVLTPHLVAPLAGSDRKTRDLNILQSGTFNAGVLGVGNTDAAHRFLAWWQDRVYTHCRHAVSEGMHYEQRWLDLAPALFEDVHVLRDPAYNVGHWNLPERAVEMQDDQALVDGKPCRVIRFSGYSPDNPFAVTRYNDRLTWKNIGPGAAMFERFRAALEDAGFHRTKEWPYAYGAFDNGAPVPDVARSLYMALGDDVAGFGDPLQASARGSFFRWLNTCGGCAAAARNPTRLWQAVHRSRPDLQVAFPDVLGADRESFLNWIGQSGVHEHRVSGQLPGACAGTDE